MTAANIAQALAYINWTLLAALGLGTLGLAYVLRQSTDATKGYVTFTCFLAALIGLLLYFSDQGLPEPTLLKIHAAPSLDSARRLAIAAFAVLAFVASVRVARGASARWVGLAGLAPGVAALSLGAVGWTDDPLHAVPLIVQMLMLAVVSGGALASVVLAHWYLVTPRISERPLVLAARWLTVALALQLGMFATWQVVGYGADGPFSALFGGSALLVWLRLVVGIVFPIVLSYLAYRTAQTRSMESATGLLYIDLAAILASTIVAAALFFGTGLLV